MIEMPGVRYEVFFPKTIDKLSRTESLMPFFLLWKAVCLSGGQQAACSLSLLLAIQDCFPSPIYIMDEVDASLDTSTVTRVGALIR